MIHVAMDSAGDAPPEWISEFEIQVIPINIHFGEQTFYQGIDISNADFYRMTEESGVIPKTSQPTPQQFVDFYKGFAKPGDTIISIHVTGKLSGTLDSAQMAANELVDQYSVFPIDSTGGSALQGYMCRDARVMERSGIKVEKIVERMKEISRSAEILLTLDTMEYARMSGRVKTLQAALASLLNVKPIVILEEGILEVGDKVRTRNRSLEYVVEGMAQRLGQRLSNVAIVHAEDLDAGQRLMEAARKKLNCNEIIMTELSIGIAANLGPGTVGVIAYPVEGG